MNWVIYLFGSGILFFLGAALVLTSVAVCSFAQTRRFTRLATLVVIIGLILISLSATPVPYGFYFIAVSITLIWLPVEKFQSARFARLRRLTRATVVAVWILGLILELPFALPPTIAPGSFSDLYIVADSVSAGIGEKGETTWPRLLAQSQTIHVHDFSRMGATAASAFKQAEELPAEGGIVLLEIGGNDLLGPTSSEQFAQDLDRLLNRVRAPGRVVVMFELPLPPLRNEFGRIQRQLAARHGALLIPKRIFISVLTTEGATLDSIHLSKQGHELMSQTVWKIIERAYAHH